MKSLFLVMLLSASSSVALAEIFICKAIDGPRAGTPSWVSAPDMARAEEFAKEGLKANSVSCRMSPPVVVGTMADLGGKKWGFQGLRSNETYLVFENQQVLHIQECGNDRVVHRFNAALVGEKSLKLSAGGVEGSCNPMIIPGFKEGSIITVNVSKIGDAPFTLLVSDHRSNEETSSTSLYQEMKF